MDFTERYRAIDARDARFDGQFITAVRTTGIYCRPSCPARTPKAANVTFYPTSAAAHEAGYRACKRCLPDAVPGSPEWNLRGDVAARAVRLIADGLVERAGVPALAARLGYSSRHLNRVLTTEVGAGPLALARAYRAQTARTLLTSTDLPMADVAFAAGFASVRQFNDTVLEVYGLTPTQVRAHRRRSDATGSPARPAAARVPAVVGADDLPLPDADDALPPGQRVALTTIDLRLPVREPFDLAGVLTWLAVRAVPGVEVADAGSYARTLALPGGPGAVHVMPDRPGAVRLRAQVTSLSDLPVLVARVRRLLDLDADPSAVDSSLATHPQLAPSVAATPGIRLPGAVDPHEMLVRAIVGQQISVAAARTQLTRLTDAAGTPVALDLVDGLTRLFPSPERIVADGEPVLVGPRARARTLLTACAALADGTLTLDVGDDAATQHARLVALPGIGPWTAGYLAMRVLGAPDVLLTGDVALRTGARRLGLPDTPRELAAWGERVSPWRSYASLHLWRAAAPVRRADDTPRRTA